MKAIFLDLSGLTLDRNQWLLAVFLIYLAVIVVFAIIYYRLYKIYPRSFVFNADILKRQSEVSKVSFEQEIEAILFKLDAFKYLLEELSRNLDHVKVETDKSGGKAVIQTVKYKFDIISGYTHVGLGGAVSSPSEINIYDPNGKIVARYGLGGFPLNVEKYTEIVTTIVQRLESSLSDYRRRLNTLSGVWPEVWSFWDFLYFSTITQTTVGYGDILPNKTVVRIVVILQILIGLLIIGILINIVFPS